jgi:threonine/homoserine/homoserine lactone efflux protein
MNEQVAIVPIAFAMVAGPQIISAVVLATSRDPKSTSLAYLAGAAVAVLLGLTISYVTAVWFGTAAESTGAANSDDWLSWILAGLLALLSVTTFLGRKTAEPPKWMKSLQEAKPGASFKLGLALFLLMPSDIVILLSVGAYLVSNELGFLEGIPFALLTILLLSLPFLGYLVLGEKAEETLPRLRDWMNKYSWAISIGVYVFFIYALLG